MSARRGGRDGTPAWSAAWTAATTSRAGCRPRCCYCARTDGR